MNDWMYDRIAAQISQERQGAAERDRLAELAKRNSSPTARFYQRWLNRSGRALVSWGLQLQSYASIRGDAIADADWAQESLGRY